MGDRLAELKKLHAGYGPSGCDAPRFFSVDTGVDHYGVARWDAWGSLGWAELVKREQIDPRYWGRGIVGIVVEVPQLYGPGKKGRRGDQNDILDLMGAAEWLIGAVEAHGCRVAVRYRPSQWKGNLPKEVCHRHVRETLSGVELERVHLPKNRQRQTDVWDAVGIGLAHLGRAPWRK